MKGERNKGSGGNKGKKNVLSGSPKVLCLGDSTSSDFSDEFSTYMDILSIYPKPSEVFKVLAKYGGKDPLDLASSMIDDPSAIKEGAREVFSVASRNVRAILFSEKISSLRRGLKSMFTSGEFSSSGIGRLSFAGKTLPPIREFSPSNWSMRDDLDEIEEIVKEAEEKLDG